MFFLWQLQARDWRRGLLAKGVPEPLLLSCRKQAIALTDLAYATLPLRCSAMSTRCKHPIATKRVIAANVVPIAKSSQRDRCQSSRKPDIGRKCPQCKQRNRPHLPRQ